LTEKFSRDIEYTNKYFPDYSKHFMLWSPIVKVPSDRAKFSQIADIEGITKNIQAKYGVLLECIINEKFGTVQNLEKAPLQFDSRQVAPERIRLSFTTQIIHQEVTCHDSLFELRTFRQYYLA
jgi:hypothetical protein